MLAWDDPSPGQINSPEACCQKVRQNPSPDSSEPFDVIHVSYVPQVLKLVAEHLFDWDEDLVKKWGEVSWRRSDVGRSYGTKFDGVGGQVMCPPTAVFLQDV